MNRHVSRSCMAVAFAGALCAGNAGAMDSSARSSAAYDEVAAPQSITVFEPGGTITSYTFADPELVGVAEPDGMITFYELTPLALAPEASTELNVSPWSDTSAVDEFTGHVPDGTGWAYVPSRFVSPEEADAINAATLVKDDQIPVMVYVASFVSPPEYSLMSTE